MMFNMKFILRYFHSSARMKKNFELVYPKTVSPPRIVPSHITKPAYWETGVVPPSPQQPDTKSIDQIENMIKSCKLVCLILDSLQDYIKIGTTTDDIDKFVHETCVAYSAYPSPLNYKGYPKSICTSVNNVACHGIPDNRRLVSGDMVNVDVTVYRNGYHGDSSRMYLVGEVDERGRRLSEVCKEALETAISVCEPGAPFSVIGDCIEHIAEENNFIVIPCFAGHGIGTYFHGPPDVYHFRNDGDVIMECGMTFTIEPVLGEGGEAIKVLDDGWTAVTTDGSRTAQWEHTVLITDDGAIALTDPALFKPKNIEPKES